MTKNNARKLYTFEISDANGDLVDAMTTYRKGTNDAHKQARDFFAEAAEVGETMDVLCDGYLVEQWIMAADGWTFEKITPAMIVGNWSAIAA